MMILLRGDNLGNTLMNTAKQNKKDEFYTLYKDIALEIDNYKRHFKNKVVYCNTDSKDSNFVKYFADNFNKLQLKLLIYSSIDNVAGFYDGNKTRYVSIDGDFRSSDSIKLLKLSDIVVSNPPFSLFREYITQLVSYNKRFIILGNNNAVTYKEVFPLIKKNKIWLGYNANKTMAFQIPDSYDKYFKIKDGKKYAKVPAISWFTNLSIDKRNKFIELIKTYKGNEEQYPKYDNYDAIEVSRVANIPKDYKGVMGVPITFLTKYNPKQFKLLGSQRWAKSQELIDVYIGGANPPESDKKTLINGKETYDRVFIKRIN